MMSLHNQEQTLSCPKCECKVMTKHWVVQYFKSESWKSTEFLSFSRRGLEKALSFSVFQFGIMKKHKVLKYFNAKSWKSIRFSSIFAKGNSFRTESACLVLLVEGERDSSINVNQDWPIALSLNWSCLLECPRMNESSLNSEWRVIEN